MHQELKTYLLYILSFFCLLLVGNFAFSYCYIASDFYQDYLAGVAVLRGKSIYGTDIINLGVELLGTNKNDNFHPPFVSVFMTFFAIFPYEYAALLQQIITFLLYSLIVYHAFKMYKIVNYKFYLPVLLIWNPIIAHFGLVQISIYLCYFLFLGYIFLRKEKHKLSSFCFALASSIKLYPLFILFFLYKIKAYKNIYYYLLFLFFINLIAFLVVGFDDFSLYFLERIKENSFASGELPFNFSIYSSLMYTFQKTKWSTPLINFEYWKLIYYFIAFIGILPFVLNRKAKQDKERLFYLSIISMLVLSPILWSHMLLILIPVLIYMLKKFKEQRPLILFAIIFPSLPLMPINNLVISSYHTGQIPWYSLFLLKIPLISLLIMWVILLKSKEGA